jgi:hypothetical protein
MTDDGCVEAERTSPLALWRYGHDYLRVARELCARHRLRAGESQVPYHAAAQGILFALLAFRHARGDDPDAAQQPAPLAAALAAGLALGLPPPPPAQAAEIAALARCFGRDGFSRVGVPDAAFTDIDGLVAAGAAILDHAAPAVAAHYIAHLAQAESPGQDEFVRRMRADLAATTGAAPARAA